MHTGSYVWCCRANEVSCYFSTVAQTGSDVGSGGVNEVFCQPSHFLSTVVKHLTAFDKPILILWIGNGSDNIFCVCLHLFQDIQ